MPTLQTIENNSPRIASKELIARQSRVHESFLAKTKNRIFTGAVVLSATAAIVFSGLPQNLYEAYNHFVNPSESTASLFVADGESEAQATEKVAAEAAKLDGQPVDSAALLANNVIPVNTGIDPEEPFHVGKDIPIVTTGDSQLAQAVQDVKKTQADN
jgi:hypothetical protein